jgi:hypothetical protein
VHQEATRIVNGNELDDEKNAMRSIEQSLQAPHMTQPPAHFDAEEAPRDATTPELEHESEIEGGEGADGESDESDNVVFQMESNGNEESAVEEPGEEVDDGESDDSDSVVFQIEADGNEETVVEEPEEAVQFESATETEPDPRNEPQVGNTTQATFIHHAVQPNPEQRPRIEAPAEVEPQKPHENPKTVIEAVPMHPISQHAEAPTTNPQDIDMQDVIHDTPEVSLQQPPYTAMSTPVYQAWTAPMITPQADYPQLQSPAQQLSSWCHEQHRNLIYNPGSEAPQTELGSPATLEVMIDPRELNERQEQTEIAAPQPPPEITNQTPSVEFEQAALLARVTVHRQDIEDKIFTLWTAADSSDHQWTATELTSEMDSFEQEIRDGVITTLDQLEKRLLKHLKDFFDLESAMKMASSQKAEEEAAGAREAAEQQARDAQNPVLVQMDRMYNAYYHEASEKLFQCSEEDLTNDLDAIKMELITRQITTVPVLEARLGQHDFRVNFTIENAQRIARGEKHLDYPWPSRREDGVTGRARSRRSDFLEGMRQIDDDVETWFTQMLARKQSSIVTGMQEKRPTFEMVIGRYLETFFEVKDIEVEQEAEMVAEKTPRRKIRATGARRG